MGERMGSLLKQWDDDDGGGGGGGVHPLVLP